MRITGAQPDPGGPPEGRGEDGRIHPGRHYGHEVFLLGWSTFIGISYLIGAPAANALAATFSPLVLKLWATSLVIAGVVGLAGCYWPRKRFDLALLLERAGLLLQSAALILFMTAQLSFAGPRGLTVAGICVAWTAANLGRVWRISVGLRHADAVANGNHKPEAAP